MTTTLERLMTFDAAECAAMIDRVERRDIAAANDRRKAGQAFADERRIADRRSESPS